MIKIAYLIIAYQYPNQVARLVESLSDSGDFYINIDKKTDDSRFKALLSGKPNVHFLPRQLRVNWGAWSIAKTYLELLNAAFNSKKKYDRFVMLTGQDYPIYSNEDIIHEFEENKDIEYVMAYKISASKLPNDKYKVLRRWFLDNPFNSKFLRKCWGFFFYHVVTKRFIRNTILVPLNGHMVEPYFGQTLSAFSRKGAELILEVYHNDKDYNKIMKHVHAPDEEYWQTIIFNSPLRNNTILHGKESEVTEHFGFAPLHYHTYLVKTSEFTEADYNDIVQSGYMFCRKVVPGKSDKLMEMIDRYRGFYDA